MHDTKPFVETAKKILEEMKSDLEEQKNEKHEGRKDPDNEPEERAVFAEEAQNLMRKIEKLETDGNVILNKAIPPEQKIAEMKVLVERTKNEASKASSHKQPSTAPPPNGPPPPYAQGNAPPTSGSQSINQEPAPDHGAKKTQG